VLDQLVEKSVFRATNDREYVLTVRMSLPSM